MIAEQKRLSPKEAALERLKFSEVSLNLAQQALQTFATENFRVIPGGFIFYSQHNREHLDFELSRLTMNVEEARDKFHAALKEWSEIETSGGNGNGN
jgi:hypothetical protein